MQAADVNGLAVEINPTGYPFAVHSGGLWWRVADATEAGELLCGPVVADASGEGAVGDGGGEPECDLTHSEVGGGAIELDGVEVRRIHKLGCLDPCENRRGLGFGPGCRSAGIDWWRGCGGWRRGVHGLGG